MKSLKRLSKLPQFEHSAEEVKIQGAKILAWSKKRTAEIASQEGKKLNFAQCLGALDQLEYEESEVIDRIYLLQNVSPHEEIRKAAQEVFIQFQEWSIERAYNRKLYQVIKDYASTNPKLEGEEAKLLKESLTDYRRAGLELSDAKQAELKELQKKLSNLETDFSTAINEFDDELWLSRDQLKGLQEDFFSHLKTNEAGLFRISLQAPEYMPVMEFCEVEETRKALMIKRYNTAAKTNVLLLNQMIALRDQLAEILGYPSFNHYVIEDRMAKTPENVLKFLDHFESKLRIKAKQELSELQTLKADESKNPSAQIKVWDYLHFSTRAKQKRFEVDYQSLKDFFPLDHVLSGFFDIIGELFSIRFKEHPAGSFDSWHPDVKLVEVQDLNSECIGYFYLDLFPRQGKYGHAAAFNLVGGKELNDGSYRSPIGCMVCNFPANEPRLMSHQDVETLFHEFGHLLHGILTTARYHSFAGSSVAWDFVEAPSQVLENWCWDPEMLNRLVRHIKDPNKKIPKETVQKMIEAKKSSSGLFYLRQVGFAKSDLAFHSQGRNKNAIEIMNRVMTETFIAPPENTNFAAGWGHMVGYASGYYGYAWADVMAADLFSVFRQKGILDKASGLKLRKEIYEPGSSRDEMLSLEAFLGRPMNDSAFFEDLGLK